MPDIVIDINKVVQSSNNFYFDQTVALFCPIHKFNIPIKHFILMLINVFEFLCNMCDPSYQKHK